MRAIATSLNPGELYPLVDFDSKVAEEIVESIANGNTISRTLRIVEFAPTLATFAKWRRQYPEFNQAVVFARQAAAERLADEINEIADDTLADPDATPAANAKVAIDAKKWLASKFAPRTYGDRLALEGKLTLAARLEEMNDDELDGAIEQLQAGINDSEDL